MFSKNSLESLWEDLHSDSESIDMNDMVVCLRARAEALLKSNEYSKEDLSEVYEQLQLAIKELTYLKGVQDGIQILHILLSGKALDHAAAVMGNKIMSKYTADILTNNIINNLTKVEEQCNNQ